MEAFGFSEPISHDEAYAMADEFVCLMKYYWSETEPFDFRGKFYQSYGGFLSPKPTRRPRPVLMNAGSSEVGLDFAARNCDWVFCLANDAAGYRERVSQIHNIAAGYRRKVRVATMCWVLPEATDALAKDKYDWIASQIDTGAVEAFAKSIKGTSTEELIRTIERLALGFTSPHIVGSYELAPRSSGNSTKRDWRARSCASSILKKVSTKCKDDIIPILKKMGLRK